MSTRKRTVAAAVEASIEQAARRQDVPVQDAVAATVAAKLTPAVLATPELQHAANAEPWIQSRVTIGAIITLIAGSYGLGMDFLDGVPPAVDAFAGQVGAIVGAGVTLYGRWIATRPLGR